MNKSQLYQYLSANIIKCVKKKKKTKKKLIEHLRLTENL